MARTRTWAWTGLATAAVLAAGLLGAQLFFSLSQGPIDLPPVPPPELVVEDGEEPAPSPVPEPARGPPNILIIVSDDQRYDSMWAMPLTQRYVFDQGATFERAYVTTPLCCPSRASILTGLYASHHGVLLNPYPLEHPTIFEDLQRAGYRTGLVGKFLNSHDGTPRPGFDVWVSHAWGTSRSFDPELNVDGEWSVHPGHITGILRDHVLSFLADTPEDQPFALVWAANAPHWSHDPAPGDTSLYVDLEPARPLSHNETDVSDKPRWLQAIAPLTSTEVARQDELRRKGLQALASLDEAIAAVVGRLHETGRLDETAIFYISDHGVFYGEHRLVEKNRVYEEAIHVPLALRYPPLVPRPLDVDALVTNLDIAATVYELADVTPSRTLDGRSLVGLITGRDALREHVFLEGWLNRAPAFTAVHTGRYVYVENAGDRNELYDLIVDPYQLDNRAGDPALAEVERDLRGRLAGGRR